MDELFDLSELLNIHGEDVNAPTYNIELSELNQILKKIIDRLPSKQKTAFTLFRYNEFSYKEIAEIMNIQINETGVLINRARAKIKKQIMSYLAKNR